MPGYALLILCGGAFLGLLVVIESLSERTNLNGIKGRTVGDGQHGSARFLTKKELHTIYTRVPYNPKAWRSAAKRGKEIRLPEGILLSCEKRGKKIFALLDSSDVHTMMVGAAGCGKTAYWLYPNLEYACACGMSFLTTDTKGDLYRNFAGIAKNCYGYKVSVIDFRNPTRSNGNNLLHLVNKYTDLAKEHPETLSYLAKAEKYAKIIAKTLIFSEGDAANYGQNAFFYDAAEGLLTSAILLVSRYGGEGERHIVSVFKLLQEMIGKGKDGKSEFQNLLNLLSEDDKIRWFAGAALNSAEQAMQSVISTAMSRLNAFLDSEMEQILCFDTEIDIEAFCEEKCAVFLVMPEEDPTKFFLVSLLIQQMYRELLSMADEMGGRLLRKAAFYMDELGTLPAIASLEMAFAAARSRNIMLVPIIQSYQQLEKNYGKEGSVIIQDNCQITIAGGFSPTSQTADSIAKALGCRTVLTGSVSRSKDHPSQSLSMIQRELMSADELKSMKKGSFVVMKTGTHPFIAKLRLHFEWGVTFDEPVYIIEEKSRRKTRYIQKDALRTKILLEKSKAGSAEIENETKPNEKKSVSLRTS